MADVLTDSPLDSGMIVDVPLSLMKMALALLVREDDGVGVSARLFQEAIDARAAR